MRTRLALFATCTALVMSAFGASPASPAADPENFRVSLHVTLGSCVGVNLLHCSFEGSAVVPKLGRAAATGEITKGCEFAFDSCLWQVIATMTTSAGDGGRTLSLGGDATWTPSAEQPPPALHWVTLENSDFVGQGTYTDDCVLALFRCGSEFTINLTGTLRLAT